MLLELIFTSLYTAVKIKEFFLLLVLIGRYCRDNTITACLIPLQRRYVSGKYVLKTANWMEEIKIIYKRNRLRISIFSIAELLNLVGTES